VEDAIADDAVAGGSGGSVGKGNGNFAEGWTTRPPIEIGHVDVAIPCKSDGKGFSLSQRPQAHSPQARMTLLRKWALVG